MSRDQYEVVVEHANGTYTIRIPKREWVGLTHPQIHELDWPDGVSFEDILLFVRAIEQALKEKNHG